MTEPVLKPGWRVWRFEQMAQSINDRVDDPRTADVEYYVGLEHLDSDSLKIRRWGSPNDVEATKLRFQKGDIIFGRRRAYQRKLGVADFDGICSAHALVLRAKPEIVLPEFLPFFMQSDFFMERAQAISVGSLSPTINWKTLAKEEFALPPLEAQKRMLELLKASERYRQKLLEMVAQVDTLWQSAASKVFHTDVGPGGSGARVLGSLLSYASDGPFGSKLKTEHYQDVGTRVVRLQNIEELSFNNADTAHISNSYFFKELSSYRVTPGDVLIAGLGDESVKVGRACLAPQDLGDAVNKADCFCLRTRSELDPSYLIYFLNSVYGLGQSKSFAQGTTRLRLNLGNIKKMLIPLPNRVRQAEVVELLSSICCSRESQRARARKHKSFDSIVRGQVFEGSYV